MLSSVRRLPDAELAVMQAIWAETPPVSRAQIHVHLEAAQHPMAETTLLTLLSRLAEKGFVRAERTGRSASYVPLVCAQDYLAQQSRRFLDQLCGGSMPAFAAALCGGGLTKQELQQLRELLERDAL